MIKCFSCKFKLGNKSYRICHGQRVCYKCFIEDLEERFYPYRETVGDCLIYPHSISPQGYGRISVLGKPLLAHRVSWFLIFGEWPKFTLNHRCEVRLCTRVFHLEDLTYRDHTAFTLRNNKSFITKQCKNGHDKTFYSTITQAHPYGRWDCRVCNKERMARRGDLLFPA